MYSFLMELTKIQYGSMTFPMEVAHILLGSPWLSDKDEHRKDLHFHI